MEGETVTEIEIGIDIKTVIDIDTEKATEKGTEIVTEDLEIGIVMVVHAMPNTLAEIDLLKVSGEAKMFRQAITLTSEKMSTSQVALAQKVSI